MPCLVHASSSLSVLTLRNLVEFQSGLMQWQCHLGCFEPSIFSPNSCTVFGRDSREVHLRIREKLTKISRPFLEWRSISGALHDRTTQEPNLDRVSPILARPKKSKPIPWPSFCSATHISWRIRWRACRYVSSVGHLDVWKWVMISPSIDGGRKGKWWFTNGWIGIPGYPFLTAKPLALKQSNFGDLWCLYHPRPGVNDFKVIGEERDLDTKTGGYRTTKSICGVCPIPIYNPADTSGHMSKKSKW